MCINFSGRLYVLETSTQSINEFEFNEQKLTHPRDGFRFYHPGYSGGNVMI